MATSSVSARQALANARVARPRRVRQELQEDQKKELKEAFDLFDAEKNGSLDYHELKVLMRALGFQVTKKEVLRTGGRRRRSALGTRRLQRLHGDHETEDRGARSG
ncbi:hypothetical protein PINS_up010696 [Pythium insidiosum]|nr:hypothetical protein PINS_up010696 [Pythium insidiosum]